MIWVTAILPALAGLVLWASGIRSPRGLAALAVLALVATLALAGFGTPSEVHWSPALTLRAELTPLSRMVALLVPLVALAVVVFAAAHEEERGLGRLLGLLLAFTGAMELTVIAGDLLTLLIGWELMGACSWALIGHHWRRPEPMASAAYAFVMTRAGDLGLFLALFVTLTATGESSFAALGDLQGAALVVAAFGVLIAAAAKAGQLPFSPWLFRAMDGPTPVSAFLHSSTMVAAGAYLIARLHPWLAEAPGFAAAAMTIGLATALAGGAIGAVQMHAKKLLAASTSAQLGLMFTAVGAGYPGIALLHLVAHAAMKAPLFFAAGIAQSETGSFDLRGMRLGRAFPWLATATLLCALALGGVPPLGAAWSKEKIVAAAGHHGPLLAVLVALAGAFSATYASRNWVMTFGRGERARSRVWPGESWPLAVLAIATLALSVIWLPAVEVALLGRLGIEPPSAKLWEVAVSIVLVAAGVVAGLLLSRLESRRSWEEWFGLPGLIDATVTRPVLRLSERAADWDDRLVDGVPAYGAESLRAFSRRFAWTSDREADELRNGGTGLVALATRLTRAAARVGSGTGERLADLTASGTAAIMRSGAGTVRRLQSGMAHHYYLFLTLGAAGAVLILTLGA